MNAAAAVAKSLQLCPTLCDPIDGSPPGSPIPGILQARTLKWVAISFSSAWEWKVKVKSLSHVRPSATPWTAVFQAPLSMGFSRQEYWSGVPLPSLPRQSRFQQIRGSLKKFLHSWFLEGFKDILNENNKSSNWVSLASMSFEMWPRNLSMIKWISMKWVVNLQIYSCRSRSLL